MGVTDADRAALRRARVISEGGYLHARAGRLVIPAEQPWLRRGSPIALVTAAGAGGDAELERGVVVEAKEARSGVPEARLEVGGASRDPALVLAARWMVALAEMVPHPGLAGPVEGGEVLDLQVPLPEGLAGSFPGPKGLWLP